MEIIICDSDEVKREEYIKLISDYVMMEELGMQIALVTADPNEVLEHVKTNADMRLYFLEIDLGTKMTGIGLAREIRRLDGIGPIIYITDHFELMSVIFEYGIAALGFIAKRDFRLAKERIAYYLDLINERFLVAEGWTEVFVYKVGTTIVRQSVKEILFFQVAEKGEKLINLHTMAGVEEFYGKMNMIEQKNHRFFRCHRSCVVNVDNISTFDLETGEITMTTGDICYGSLNGVKKLSKIINNS